MELISRPWIPQDLLDDLQMYIDEENDSYLNGRRTAMCMARDYLSHYFKAEEEGRLIELPCKIGDKVYRIWKTEGREPTISEHYITDIGMAVRWMYYFGNRVFLTFEEAEAALRGD
jgi:hypothetical protein